jgi:hypothetical protein
MATLEFCFKRSNLRIMKTLNFISFFVIILFTGCSDPEGIMELKGKVLDRDTKTAIPRREIIVHAFVKDENGFTRVYAGQFNTDSSGRFTYSLMKVRNSWLYSFSVSGDSTYAFSTHKFGMTDLKRDGKFLTFYLNRLTDLTITIERQCKLPGLDTLFLSWESNGINGKILYPYTLENYGVEPYRGYIWIGGDIRSAIKTKTFADKKTIIYWKLYRNGTRKEVIDTIFCIRDLTNYVNFKY